jgi:hypothetical protein
MSWKRTERRTYARGLTIDLYNQDQTTVLGEVRDVEWFDDVTLAKGRSDDPWQEVGYHTQLAGRLSDTLSARLSSFGPLQFWVSFSHNGEAHHGRATVRKRRDSQVLLSVQGGLKTD